MEEKYVYVTIKDGEIYSFTDALTLEDALDSCDVVGADSVLKIDATTVERLLTYVK